MPSEEGGSALVSTVAAMIVVGLLSLVLVDIANLYRTSARAQQAADAAALAASVAAGPNDPSSPTAAANEVATANGVEVVQCDCWWQPASVTVAASVPSVLLHRIGLSQVTATGSAVLLPVD